MNRLKNGKIRRVLYSSFEFSTISTTPKARPTTIVHPIL